MNEIEQLQASSKTTTNLVIELVADVKEHRMSPDYALKLLDESIRCVKERAANASSQVRALMQPYLDFFNEARKVIAQVKQTQN
jgi:hypothetical protein